MFVSEYAEIYSSLPPSKIKGMLETSLYRGYTWEPRPPGLKTVFIDAGVFKESPWLEMALIERQVFGKATFYTKGMDTWTFCSLDNFGFQSALAGEKTVITA